MSVGMSVCLSDDNFRKHRHTKFIFVHPVYLDGIRVKFVYEGRRVKVKVTGAKKRRKSLFLQCKTSTGHNSGFIKHRASGLRAAWGFRLWQIEWCNHHLCHVTGSDYAYTKCTHSSRHFCSFSPVIARWRHSQTHCD